MLHEYNVKHSNITLYGDREHKAVNFPSSLRTQFRKICLLLTYLVLWDTVFIRISAHPQISAHLK